MNSQFARHRRWPGRCPREEHGKKRIERREMREENEEKRIERKE
jgi:hypothetical protein